jgi:hypothetical protein
VFTIKVVQPALTLSSATVRSWSAGDERGSIADSSRVAIDASSLTRRSTSTDDASYMADHRRPITSAMLDCVIEHFPIIGVGDLPTPYTHGSQLTRPHARVVTQRLGDRMPWFVRVSVRLGQTS